MHKLQKSLPLSSLVWAAVVTAIVLALAASANAHDGHDHSDIAVVDNDPAGSDVRPVPRSAPLMLRATSSAPRAIGLERGVPPAMNATGTRNMSATGTRNMNPEAVAARETAFSMQADRRADFEERRATLIEEMTARRAQIAEKRAMIASSTMARRALLKEEAQKRIVDRADRLTGVVQAAIGRLETMSARLREHAGKLADRSVNVTATLALLDEVDTLLDSASDSLAGVGTNISYAASSDTPKEDWADAREQFMAVRSILADARELLREALASLKAAARSATEEASEDEDESTTN